MISFNEKVFIKYADKPFFKQWEIGISQDNFDDIIRDDIIRNENFDSEINWLIP